MANYPPIAAKRLAAAVRKRRSELSRTQVEVWQHGGPANSTLTAIEAGTHTSITSVTLHRLDVGLGWPPGTASDILFGQQRPRDPLSMKSTAELFVLLNQVVVELRGRAFHTQSVDDWGGLDPDDDGGEDGEQAPDFGKA